VTLSASSPATGTVGYASADGSATAGSDYTAVSGTLSFAPGTTLQTIGVPVLGDTAVELDETFLVNLSAAVNATVADGQGQGTITNDDVPAVSVGDAYVIRGRGVHGRLVQRSLSAASTRRSP
jgi:chitinase